MYKRVHVTILFKTTWAINPSSSVSMKKADTVKSVNKHVARFQSCARRHHKASIIFPFSHSRPFLKVNTSITDLTMALDNFQVDNRVPFPHRRHFVAIKVVLSTPQTSASQSHAPVPSVNKRHILPARHMSS